MVDVEKIKKGLDVCGLRSAGDCTYCPYFESTYCDTLLASDAAEYIASLEERLSIMQESMEEQEKQDEPIIVNGIQESHYEDYVTWFGTCPSCGVELKRTWNPKYCGLCGQVVKWE